MATRAKDTKEGLLIPKGVTDRALGEGSEEVEILEGYLGGGTGFWGVMRVYPEESLGAGIMSNSTSYDHESILDAIIGTGWI